MAALDRPGSTQIAEGPLSGWASRGQGGLLVIIGLVLVSCPLLIWVSAQGQEALILALLVALGGFVLILFRPEMGLLIFLSTLLLTYPDVLKGSGLLTINNLLGGVFLFLLLRKLSGTRDLWFLREREIRLFLFIGLLFLVSTVVTAHTIPTPRYAMMWNDETQSWMLGRDLTQKWLITYFSRVAFIIFLINFISTARHVRYVLLTMLVCIAIAFPAAIQAYMTAEGTDFRISASNLIVGPSGWIGNPNRFAFMCLVAASLLYCFAMSTQIYWLRLLLLLSMIVPLILTILSGSRSGFLGLLFLGGWLFVQSKDAVLTMRISFLVLGVCALIGFFTLAPPRVQSRLLNINPFATQGEGSSSIQTRTATAGQALSIFAQHPFFGVGLGNFRWVNGSLNSNIRPPHNSYLWALAEGGILCLSCYLLLFFALLKRLRSIRRVLPEDLFLRMVVKWLPLYLLLFMFFSFFADVWLVNIHLYFITGMSIILHRLVLEQQSDPQSQALVTSS